MLYRLLSWKIFSLPQRKIVLENKFLKGQARR
jgi:hypothetical protein